MICDELIIREAHTPNFCVCAIIRNPNSIKRGCHAEAQARPEPGRREAWWVNASTHTLREPQCDTLFMKKEKLKE